jgi:uncharacterized membrane protein
VVFTLFSQQKALETLLFGRLFGAWLFGVAFGFGAVYTSTSAERGEAPGIHRGVMQAAGVSEQRIHGINIIFTTTSIGDVIVWPFVWFVVAFGFGACCTYIGRERGEAPGIHRSIRKRRGLSEQHMRGIYIIFSTKSIGDIVVWPFVWFVVAFGFVLYIHGRERGKTLGFIAAYARAGDYQSSTYVVFTLFQTKNHFETLLLGRVFGLWSCSVLVRAVHTSAEKEARRLGFIAACARGGDYEGFIGV